MVTNLVSDIVFHLMLIANYPSPQIVFNGYLEFNDSNTYAT